MYITMNRFQIAEGRGEEFEEVWRNRDSYLSEVEGFREFCFLRGPEGDYVSHTTWDSKEAFEGWVGSEAFHKAHAQAGKTPEDIFKGPPQISCYEVVLHQKK